MLLEVQCIVIYQNLWKFTDKRVRYQTKMLRNYKKISSIFFLQLNINDTKAASHEYISSKKLTKLYRIFKVLTKFREK